MSEVTVIALVAAASVTAICVKQIEAEDVLEFLTQNYDNASKLRSLIGKGHLLTLTDTPDESVAVSTKPSIIQCKLQDLAQRLFGAPAAVYLYNEEGSPVPEGLTARGRQYDKVQTEGNWTEYQNLEMIFSEGTNLIAA